MDREADAEQARVLDHEAGALVVTGPPGSGKTALLRERFARLVEAGADPERVVLFVLNRRAAREARDHLVRRLARSLADLPVFTVHGFGFRVLGIRFGELGYEEPPQVLSAAEQYATVREMLREESEDEWPHFRHLLRVHGFARQVADFVLRAQERLLDPDSLERLADGHEEYREVAAFYRRYLDGLTAAGQVDFAGLLFQTVKLLEAGAEPGFDHVLVDDYQDATHAAEAMLRALAPRARSVVVAADPEGHVFSYRGGSIEPYLRIETTVGKAERVSLPWSYRLEAEGSALAPLDDPSAPAADIPPRWLTAHLSAHPGEEAEAGARELLRLRMDEDVPWERMAIILRRYGGYLTAVRHALSRHEIPFVVVAEEAAVAREPANRPVIDLLRYSFRENLRDDLLEPLLASRLVGLEPNGLRQLRRGARARKLSLRELVEEADPGLLADLRDPVMQFRQLVVRIPEVARERGPDGVFFALWAEVPFFRELVASEQEHRDLDALAALGDLLGRFVERRPGSTVEDYLDTLEAAEFGPDPWVPPEERHPRAVRIISAHRAQGLEFGAAVVLGCSEGEFPSLSHHYPLLDLAELIDGSSPRARAAARLAEERALFRLAVSRSRRTVVAASTSSGARNPRTPSRFVERLGLKWSEPPRGERPPTSLRSMEASLRRVLADRSGAAPERLAALGALPVVGAQPETWWGHRDWTDPGAPLHEGVLRSSYSRLSTLQNCGLQYLYQVEMGLDPDPTHQMWMGSLVHDLIDRVQRGELPRDDPAAMHAALDDAWDPDRFPNLAIAHRRHLDAHAMIDRWLAGETSDPVRSEVAFAFELDGAVMRGRIDAIFRMENGHLRVVDYKTSRYAIPQKDAKEDLQLAAYYLAVKRDADLSTLGPPGLLQLAYLGKASMREHFTRRAVSPSAVEGYEAWAENTIRELVTGVRTEDFAPNPEADCMFCSFKTICPVWPEGGEVAT